MSETRSSVPRSSTADDQASARTQIEKLGARVDGWPGAIGASVPGFSMGKEI
jgi:hypothetical protein